MAGLILSRAVFPVPSSVSDTLQAQEEMKIQFFFEGPLGVPVFARITIAALAINYTFISFLILA